MCSRDDDDDDDDERRSLKGAQILCGTERLLAILTSVQLFFFREM